MNDRIKCPICSGYLQRNRQEYIFHGTFFGEYDADVCVTCGEPFFTEEASDEIDKKAKELVPWGVKR